MTDLERARARTFSPCPCPRSSPWGAIQDRKQVAPGVWWVSTAGHGGILLSQERWDAMPERFRDTFAGPRAFEEDCDWALVAYVFSDVARGTGVSTEDARKVVERWHPNALKGGGCVEVEVQA